MKVILQIEMDESEYVAILQTASMKNLRSEELIRMAIREYVNQEMKKLRKDDETE